MDRNDYFGLWMLIDVEWGRTPDPDVLSVAYDANPWLQTVEVAVARKALRLLTDSLEGRFAPQPVDLHRAIRKLAGLSSVTDPLAAQRAAQGQNRRFYVDANGELQSVYRDHPRALGAGE